MPLMIMSEINQFKHLIIIGGQRCGTSFALNLLKKINKFKLTREILPEPKYFLKNTFDYHKYLENFYIYSNKDVDKIFVEKSTTYYERPLAIKNITSNLKDYQILLFIRDPIERAVSNYYFSKKNGFEKLDINQAFEREIYKTFPKRDFQLSTDPLDYLNRSAYFKLINNFINYIPSNKINIFTFERLISKPHEFISFLSLLLNIPEIIIDFKSIKKSDFLKKINSSESNDRQILEKDILAELKKLYECEKLLIQDKFSIDLSSWQI